MIPLTNYHVLLPYHLEQLEQERRFARYRQVAAFARRQRRGRTIPSHVDRVVTLAHIDASPRSDDAGLPEAA